MSLLSDLTNLVETLDIPVETGVFSDTAPDRYLVLIPMRIILRVSMSRRCVSPYTRRAATPKRRTLL